MEIIEKHIDQIEHLCRNFKVKNLFVFGSILTNEFNAQSDIDLVVEFYSMDPIEYLDNYYELKFTLEDIFGRKVDLLESQAISNPVFKHVLDNTKALIYEGEGKELVN